MSKTNIHRRDYPSLKEYNRARMKFYNSKKHMVQRLERYKDLFATIREIEKENPDEEHVIAEIAKNCKYKLVIDKDIHPHQEDYEPPKGYNAKEAIKMADI